MMRIVENAQTPTGQFGQLIECTCRTHPEGKTRAITRHIEDMPEGRIHGLVLAAWHPLSGAQSVQRFGPWRA